MGIKVAVENTPNISINFNNNNNINNNIINNNYLHNYHNQRTTLRDTDNLYKNYFSNNNINIHTINKNDKYINNNHLNSNTTNDRVRDHYRNQRNSIDKIMSNKYPTPNIYSNTPNIERFGNMNNPHLIYLIALDSDKPIEDILMNFMENILRCQSK